ncbi:MULTISPECIES: ATP-binding protein [unclassified Streptomyces]|uniref:ATP-binding protein n=1 Tax=unclassified Streptomyces TaxID=2593676 RepID=UPI001F1AC8F9|nr:ATP-binding protein [Streptomyces sp. CcalMP-8W]
MSTPMDLYAPVDLTGWKPVLRLHGITEEEINDVSGDPNDRAGVIRREIDHANRHVPFIYSNAVADAPEVLAWADALIAGASGRIVKSIGHSRSLLLLGVTGVGKTHQAFGVLRYMAPLGVRLGWTAVSAVDLYAALKPRHGVDSETEFWKYAKAPLLIVDDLGAGRTPTEFTEEVNFRLVNHRYENQLPTLFTSNVVPRELIQRVGDRVASRLVEMCDRVVMEGEDKRRKGAA